MGVYARNRDGDLSHTLEAEVEPAIPGLLEAAATVGETLSLLLEPLRGLLRALADRLDEPRRGSSTRRSGSA